MNTRRYIAAFLAAVIGMSLTVGCGKEDSKDKEKESKSVSDSEKDESSDKNEESDKDEESEKDKDESSDKDTATTKRPSRTERWEISKAEEGNEDGKNQNYSYKQPYRCKTQPKSNSKVTWFEQDR